MQKNMEKRPDKKQIFQGIALILTLGIICVLVYKAQVRENLYQPMEYTMMTEHKDTSEVVLSEESPEMSELFLCKVSELKKLRIECAGKKAAAGAMLFMALSDVETGAVYYHAEKTVREILDSRKDKKVEIELPEPIADSEGRIFLLTWKLKDAGSTVLTLTANRKQVLVRSFNGQEADKTNVIYTLYYGDNRCLKILYVCLCAALLAFAGMCYWMLVIRRMSVEKFYLPTALFLGMIFQCLITVGGVPDEPGHLDTAYKYSNKILLVEDTDTPCTIYKRRCDAEMSEMLANGLESNSYYQLLTDTFRKADHTELIETESVDSTNLVPGIVYIPGALGISAGRVLGLSAMFTMQLARIFNLVVYVLLVFGAIRLIPFGKNLMGMIALLPIALQQGASASYDAVINGLLMLFFALCMYMAQKQQKKSWELALAGILALFTAAVKGGVYMPMLLMLVPAFIRKKQPGTEDKKKKMHWGIVLAVSALVLSAVFYMKFMPVLRTLMQSADTGSEMQYTISYVLQNPLKVVYMYWNTFMEKGDFLLRGLLGGTLSWLDFQMSWLFEVVFLLCILLMVNMEGDRCEKRNGQKLLIALVCVISAVLIMMSMLVGYTRSGVDYIQGLQGRYFLPLAPAAFLLTSNHMVHVQKKQYAGVWMTMLVTEVLLALQVTAMIG